MLCAACYHFVFTLHISPGEIIIIPSTKAEYLIKTSFDMLMLQTDGSFSYAPLQNQFIHLTPVTHRSLYLTSYSCCLVQCAEEQRHVPESLYPFTYNPKMSLNLSQVPNCSQRSPTSRRTQHKDITEVRDVRVLLNM